MAFRQLTLIVLDGTFAVCRLAADAPVPVWATADDFFNLPLVRMLIGMAIGSVLVWFANRKLLNLQGLAAKELAATYQASQQPLDAKRTYEQIQKENPATEVAQIATQKLQALK